MPDPISFNEEPTSAAISPSSTKSGNHPKSFTEWLIQKGICKNVFQVNITLIIFSILCLCVTYYIIQSSSQTLIETPPGYTINMNSKI